MLLPQTQVVKTNLPFLLMYGRAGYEGHQALISVGLCLCPACNVKFSVFISSKEGGLLSITHQLI